MASRALGMCAGAQESWVSRLPCVIVYVNELQPSWDFACASMERVGVSLNGWLTKPSGTDVSFDT